MMNKADEKALGGLHGQLADILSKAIGQEYVDGERNKILNVARQFLKDNRIEAQAVQGSPLAGLADLPIFDDDNIIPLRNAR